MSCPSSSYDRCVCARYKSDLLNLSVVKDSPSERVVRFAKVKLTHLEIEWESPEFIQMMVKHHRDRDRRNRKFTKYWERGDLLKAEEYADSVCNCGFSQIIDAKYRQVSEQLATVCSSCDFCRRKRAESDFARVKSDFAREVKQITERVRREAVPGGYYTKRFESYYCTHTCACSRSLNELLDKGEECDGIRRLCSYGRYGDTLQKALGEQTILSRVFLRVCTSECEDCIRMTFRTELRIMKEERTRGVELGVHTYDDTKHCSEDCACAGPLKRLIEYKRRVRRESSMWLSSRRDEEIKAETDRLTAEFHELCDGCEHCVCARAHALASD